MHAVYARYFHNLATIDKGRCALPALSRHNGICPVQWLSTPMPVRCAAEIGQQYCYGFQEIPVEKGRRQFILRVSRHLGIAFVFTGNKKCSHINWRKESFLRLERYPRQLYRDLKIVSICSVDLYILKSNQIDYCHAICMLFELSCSIREDLI